MAEIQVNVSVSRGSIKPVNGICNAPQKRTLKYWKQAELPFTRLHDSFLGTNRAVDISAVFPDFHADEQDPANYSFDVTDRYIAAVLESGAQIVYRLGETLFDSAVADRLMQPPEDFEKWGRICVQIIRHYNEGWANGFHYGIRYWEIWNEPDSNLGAGDGFLKGTFIAHESEFFRFYCTASSIIKRECPGVLVGGYAPCAVDDPGRYELFQHFLEYLDTHAHAMDFFTFHAYADSAEKLRRRLKNIDTALSAHGKGDLPLIVTEVGYFWENCMWAELGRTDNDEVIDEMMHDMRSARAAAFYATAISIFQNSKVYIANFYRTDYMTMWENLFDEIGVPRKPYYALRMFAPLRRDGRALACDCSADGVTCVAAGDEDRALVYIAQYTGIARRYSFRAEGLNGTYTVSRIVTDENNTEMPQEGITVTADGAAEFRVYLRPCSITLMELKK